MGTSFKNKGGWLEISDFKEITNERSLIGKVQCSSGEDWHVTHLENHWSNKTTMITYISNITVPFVKNIRKELKKTDDQAALAIFDKFKGQIFTFACFQVYQNIVWWLVMQMTILS